MEFVNVLAACDQIPAGVFNVVHLIILLIQIAVPILLIIWGMLDFARAVIGGDEDKIKAGQKLFIKRLIAAVIVFLVVTITTLLINLVGEIGAEGVDSGSITSCVQRFVNGS